jgi:hypothetical protein
MKLARRLPKRSRCVSGRFRARASSAASRTFCRTPRRFAQEYNETFVTAHPLALSSTTLSPATPLMIESSLRDHASNAARFSTLYEYLL